MLGVELKHASTKHAQTIGMLERTHATVKTHLKAATGEFRNIWHKFLPLVVLNHNTTYHASLGCEPTCVFHGRIPHNILDYKLGYNPNPRYTPLTDIAEEIQRRMEILNGQTKKNIMQSYLKYTAYYDRKAKAAPLTTTDYCYILNPKADTQATKIPFREFRWIGPYKVEKVLPNNNYIVRRLETNKTQLLHQLRLRKFTPSAPLANNFVRETDWQKDDNIIVTHDDLYAHTWDTNFDTDPFDTELPDNEQDDIQECVPINRPPSLENSKNSGGAPEEQTTVPNVETPTENAGNEIDAIDNQQDLLPNPTIDAEKYPENTAESQEKDEVQKEKTPTNTRGEKYNLRPNPNPNFSDSYRH